MGAQGSTPGRTRQVTSKAWFISVWKVNSAGRSAVARAVVVRDALLARGAPNARVFLAAPKLCDGACDETWRPHVELSLGAH